MAWTPQEFAARVRAKYPGEYDDLSDDELTTRVVAKYPEYRDDVSISSRTAATPTLDDEGITGAEVKRRAAAGEPITRKGFRRATLSEAARADAANLVAGFGGGVAQAGGLVADALIDATAGSVRRLRGEKVEPAMNVTKTAIAATTDAAKTFKEALGVDPNAITDTGEAAFRLAGELASPVPALKGARPKAIGAVDEVVEETARRIGPKPAVSAIEDTPKGDGLVPVPKVEPEIKLPTSEVELEKYARPSSINLERLNITDDAKVTLTKTAEHMRPELEKLRGRAMSNDEIIEDAAGATLLRRVISRAESARNISQQLRTRQHLAGLLEGKTPVTADTIERIRQVTAFATDAGRRLQAQKIIADPIMETMKSRMLKRLDDLGHDTDEIVKASEGVDFDDARQATEFFRKFVKPKLGELLDEYRYANMLSSPRTHVVNAFSNAIQVGVLRPVTKLASGGIDYIWSAATGTTQKHFASEAPAYVRGAANALGPAASEALKALTGKRAITHLDLDRIPTGSKLTAPFRAVSNLLEAGDVFFRTMAERGEIESLAERAAKSGEEMTEVALARIQKEAKEAAAESIFRKQLDPSNESGHGYALARIDKITGAVEEALNAVPGGRWVVPFIRTPANILKQGIEFSPLGVTTIPGSTRKVEQIAKTFIGTTVFAGAAGLALEGRTTWSVPKGQKEKAAFYAAGLQPYSVKIGDKWVSYTKIGPLAYPIAIAAVAKHYSQDAPETAGTDASEKMVRILGGIAEFFSDQSYVQGLATILEVPKGMSDLGGAVTKTASNFATQLVPFSALQRWVAQIIDPVYRKSARRASIESVIENVKKGIPFLSKSLPAYKTREGQDSQRPFPLLNAVSPVSISEEDPSKKKRYDTLQAARRQVQLWPARSAAR